MLNEKGQRCQASGTGAQCHTESNVPDKNIHLHCGTGRISRDHDRDSGSHLDLPGQEPPGGSRSFCESSAGMLPVGEAQEIIKDADIKGKKHCFAFRCYICATGIRTGIREQDADLWLRLVQAAVLPRRRAGVGPTMMRIKVSSTDVRVLVPGELPRCFE